MSWGLWEVCVNVLISLLCTVHDDRMTDGDLGLHQQPGAY